MVSISGYGQSGPLRDKRGYGVICETFGITPYNWRPRPSTRPGRDGNDRLYHGLYGAMGAMMALLNAKDTGIGQEIDLALYEAAFESTRNPCAKL